MVLTNKMKWGRQRERKGETERERERGRKGERAGGSKAKLFRIRLRGGKLSRARSDQLVCTK